MRHLSLFSGVGGIDLGFERAGFESYAQVERDPYCQRVLRERFPAALLHDDVDTFGAWWDQHVVPIDVLSAGFPCQPFSFAGKMEGMRDDRWKWPETRDAIRRVRPRYVLLENVSALTRHDAFGVVLSDLHALGFDAEWATLRASDFGAPHNRERVYVLAYPARLNGHSRGGVGESGERGSPFTTGGLPRPSVPESRRAADAWLAREPRVDRLADGIPAQLDRLRVAGNAVVPQAAEWFGRIIAKAARVEAVEPVSDDQPTLLEDQ